MERNVIAIIGIHGSGKSRLARKVTQELQPHLSIDHVPVGDRIRKIGRKLIESSQYEAISDHLNGPHALNLLDDNVMYSVMNEALNDYRGSDTIIFDGFPRTEDQAEQLDMLALVHKRRLAGFIRTDTTDENAVERMLLRNPRDYEGTYTVTAARKKVHEDRAHYHDMALALNFPALPLHTIDTSGEKEDTITAGLRATKQILHLPDRL
ncbi:MAG: adenylate kinase [Candidatus Saccharibacteria bacterium]|nr:adenylate kinase [Candidatus Saccharibacteria bacterium]